MNKKEHDSDEEVEEPTPSKPEKPPHEANPVSPPSQAHHRPPRPAEVEQMIRYSYMEDVEEGVLFEEESTELQCPYWGTKALSLVEYKNNILGYLVSLILLFALGWMSFCILPLVLSLTKSAVHRCAKWLNEVKDNSFLGFNSMEDKVISFNIGNFGVILSRKYLLYIVMSVLAFIVLFLLLTSGINMDEERPLTNIKWIDYKDDVGLNAFKRAPRETIRLFDRKYAGKAVTWDGYVVQTNALNEEALNHYQHASDILVKMVPDDRDQDDPSIALVLSEAMTEKFKEELMQLDTGNHILFNATLFSMGDSRGLHHLHLFGLKKIQGSAHVNYHTHKEGRYKIHQEGNQPY